MSDSDDREEQMRWAKARLSEENYKKLSAYVESVTGIRMPPNRLTMLEGRLRTRLRTLRMMGFSQYCKVAFDRGGNPAELAHLIDRASTHTTEFFREAAHFDYLSREALPTLRRSGSAGELFIWSAGCSTGEEAYTIAMVLADEAMRDPELRYKILATDVSKEVLEVGLLAVYPEERTKGIPRPMRQRYLLSSRNRSSPTVRIVQSLRGLVSFACTNLTSQDFSLPRPVDILFCRNVFIYFDRRLQHEIVLRFCRNLAPGGYLFLGHTDTINGLDVPLVQVAPSVYRRAEGAS